MSRRILLLTTDLEIGGTPTVVRELAFRLHRPPEVIVAVACLAAAGPVARQIQEGQLSVFPLNARGSADFRILPRLIRLIRGKEHGGNYDTVFSFLIHANTVAAAARCFCPSVRFLQSIQTTQSYPQWHWRLQALIERAAETIVVPSRSVADMAISLCGIAPEKIQIISNASQIQEEPMPAAPREHEGRFRIGFLGRLDPVKRVPDLIQAMESLESAELLIFGQGPQRPQLESIVASRNLGHRVRLLGAVTKPAEALEQMDLLVLPSEAEGFGLVLIEAMGAGVPIVATDAPGIRDVVRDGQSALLVPIGSPVELASAIQRLMHDVQLRRRLVEQARVDVARRFSWEKILPQYKRLLRIDP